MKLKLLYLKACFLFFVINPIELYFILNLKIRQTVYHTFFGFGDRLALLLVYMKKVVYFFGVQINIDPSSR